MNENRNVTQRKSKTTNRNEIPRKSESRGARAGPERREGTPFPN
jgi:hypothetical protein